MQTYDLINDHELPEEADRLQTQVHMGWKFEKKKLAQFGNEHEIDFLDLGCGPGVFSQLVATEFPHWRITGIDTEKDILPNVSSGAVRFMHYEAGNQLPFADNSFDIIYCRFLFQHVTDTTNLLQEIFRVLKPQGSIIAVDVDDRGTIFSPTQPWIKEIYQAAAAIQKELHANRMIGAALPQLFSNQSFEITEFEIMPISNYLVPSATLMELAFGLKRRFLASSPATESLVADLDTQIKAFTEIPGHVAYIPIFYCRAIKPL
jgi:ubiquinone/menaquinone biosynthesis C-methylase UbiE